MTILGRGAQYTVFATAEGRVRKVPLTCEESRQVVASWYAPNAAPAGELAVDYLQMTKAACATIRRVLAADPEVAPSLGNPIFDDEATYTQDKTRTLGQALESASSEDGKTLLAGYVDLTLYHWKFGFSDLVFNCVINNGVNRDGQIVLIDFGEVTDRKAEVEARIAAQGWLSAVIQAQVAGSVP